MKTAKEKAMNLLFGFNWIFQLNDNEQDALQDGIELLLKEQDRDTRHACAETVLQMTGMAGAASLIPRKAAHDACMNVKAV